MEIATRAISRAFSILVSATIFRCKRAGKVKAIGVQATAPIRAINASILF
jgi:hypothetical protein